MSINSLAVEAAAVRRARAIREGTALATGVGGEPAGNGGTKVAANGGEARRDATQPQRPAAAAAGTWAAHLSRRSDATAALTKYIPTESITLYVAVISASKAISIFAPWFTGYVAYATFVVLTPVLLLVLYQRGLVLAGEPAEWSPRRWPWWKMSAATVAFLVWAFAVPGNPVFDQNEAAAGAVAALLALIVSTVLHLLSPFFETAED